MFFCLFFRIFLLKASGQLRVPGICSHVFDGVIYGPFLTNQYQNLLCPGHAGVEKISLKHDKMAHGKGHDHDGILASLGLMYGRGISQRQLVQLADIIDDCPPIEIHSQLPLFHVYL